MVCIDLVCVKQKRMADLAAQKFTAESLEMRKNGVHILDVGINYLFGRDSVTACFRVHVSDSVDVVVIIDGNGSDGITAGGKKLVKPAAIVLVRPGSKLRVPIVTQAFPFGLEQFSRDGLSSDHVGSVFFEGRSVDRDMREAVIAEVVSRIEPRLKQCGTTLDLARDVDSIFVDEPDRGNSRFAQLGEEVSCHVLELFNVSVSRRQVV